MKLPQILALALAGCCLASCTGTKEVITDAVTTVTTAITTVITNDTPSGPITPGDAEKHLVKTTDAYTLYSPDGNLFITVTTDGQMGYSVSRTSDGKTIQWIRPSKLGVNINNTSFFQDATVTSATVKEVKVSYPLNGIMSTVNGHCMEAVLNLSSSGAAENDYRLEIRAYNDGVAFRYVMPDTGKPTSVEDLTTYVLREDTEKCWYGVGNQDYEAEIKEYTPNRKSADVITAPLTAELKADRGYIAIMEGALNDSYPGTNLKAEGRYTYSTCFYTPPTLNSGVLTTGWRLINIADDLNELVNNTNIYTVNEAPDQEIYADTSWIEVGRSSWSWLVSYYPTYEQMIEFTVNCSKLGFEYNIIDDGWPGWADYQKKLTDLGLMGEDLNVKQLLWCAITAGTDGKNKIPTERSVNTFFKLLKDCHLSGAKVDFWWSEANVNTTALQEYILELSAKNQMIIDFHGCNKNTGLNITYPNELTREGVRGLENIGLATTTNYGAYAQWLNNQLYTRFLCGHADWTPATFNAMEIASLILIDSPLMVIASDPQAILESPAVEFIKSIPTVWDQTIVLPESEIGKYSVFAKENKGNWFVGGVASATINAKVKLSDFLPAGTYTAEIWVDGANGMECKTITVTEKDTIDIGSITAGKGYAIRLSKLSLSQYGGMISAPIEVTAPNGATVKYTTDGSDPMTSSTAKTVNGTITLTESCRLKVAITDGDGKGTVLSYQFNKIDPAYTFNAEIVHGEGKTTLNLSVAEGATIHYTIDGTTPTTASPVAGTSMDFTEACTFKYLIVSDSSTKSGSLNISILKTLEVPKSDLPLTDAKPLSSSIGWGSAHYDTSMSPDNGMGTRPISLGGTDIDNGTKFDRGISANATSTFKYAVPEGYTRFVGVVGIDDCVFKNTTDRDKASSTLKIAFDNNVVYESTVFRMGEYVYFDVAIPAGATTMTLTFTDGGQNGATCDNVSLAAPGWVK